MACKMEKEESKEIYKGRLVVERPFGLYERKSEL
jgi:hypothetical protein